MRKSIHILIGTFYAMLVMSIFTCGYNFFDIRRAIPEGQPALWLIYFLVPPVVLSILDKLRVIFFPKEHENVFRDQLLSINTLVAETVAWAIPNIIAGILWSFGVLLAYGLLYYLSGFHMLNDVAAFLGLIIQPIK